MLGVCLILRKALNQLPSKSIEKAKKRSKPGKKVDFEKDLNP